MQEGRRPRIYPEVGLVKIGGRVTIHRETLKPTGFERVAGR